MKLNDIEIKGSKVYVVANGHTYRYEKEVLEKYGNFFVENISIINGSVFLTLCLYYRRKFT